MKIKGIYGGRSQDRTVDLLLVRLTADAYGIDSLMAAGEGLRAYSALIDHNFDQHRPSTSEPSGYSGAAD